VRRIPQEFCRERPQHCAVVGRGAVASHYSYYTQRSGLGTQTDVLRQYRDIAMSVCGELVRSRLTPCPQSPLFMPHTQCLSPHQRLGSCASNISSQGHVYQKDLVTCQDMFDAENDAWLSSLTLQMTSSTCV